MDPPEALGRYFGCNHVEKQQVKLPKSEHPFARVFEVTPAAVARGNPEPVRTEDYWELNLDVGAAIRHHCYPHKKRHVPTEQVQLNPKLGFS